MNSSSSKALPKLSRGTGCSACVNPSTGSAPTRCVGESGVTSSGRSDSIPRNSRINSSYWPSDTSGSSST